MKSLVWSVPMYGVETWKVQIVGTIRLEKNLLLGRRMYVCMYV